MIAFLVLYGGQAVAQEAFYKGKVVKIVVGFSAGGGYDTYARLIGRHMTRHIVGNPTIVVENMPGAGSLVSANFLYKVAKPDGLTVGHFIGGLFTQQLLEKPGIEFDARRFEYIGVPTQDNYVTAVSKASGISSIQQWLSAKSPVKLGGIAPGTATSDIPRILISVLDLPAQVVDGYKGTADMRLTAVRFRGSTTPGSLSSPRGDRKWNRAVSSPSCNTARSATPICRTFRLT